MPQDHNARNHYGDFNRLRRHRWIAPIDLTQGTYHAYRAYNALFFGAPPALYDPAGFAPALSSLSSLSSHIFCTSFPFRSRDKGENDTSTEPAEDPWGLLALLALIYLATSPHRAR